jgi:hypothetical protein
MSWTRWDTSTAACWAAKGVLFRDPLKPLVPALAQATVSPLSSVMVINVLLKVDWIWTTPFSVALLAFLLRPAFRDSSGFAIFLLPLLFHYLALARRGLLLDGYRGSAALSRPGIGVRPLTPCGQTLSMAKPAVASHVHQPLDVHAQFLAQFTFNLVLSINNLPDACHLGFVKFIGPDSIVNLRLVQNVPRRGPAYSIDVGQSDFHPLIGQVHSGYPGHAFPPDRAYLSLSLFMAWI